MQYFRSIRKKVTWKVGGSAVRGRIRKGGRDTLPPSTAGLHLFYLDALVGAYFNATHAPNALSCLERIGLAVVAHLIHLRRTDVDALSASSAAVKVNIDQVHCNLLIEYFSRQV